MPTSASPLRTLLVMATAPWDSEVVILYCGKTVDTACPTDTQYGYSAELAGGAAKVQNTSFASDFTSAFVSALPPWAAAWVVAPLSEPPEPPQPAKVPAAKAALKANANIFFIF